MIIFLDSSGNIDSASSPEKIGRNSNDASNIYIVAPISSAAVIYLTFKLPNGETLFGGIADSGAEPPTEETAQTASYLFTASGLSVWQYKLKSSITRLSGIVQYSIYTITESMTASATGTFTVSKGNKITLPEIDAEAIPEATLSEILKKISEVDSDLAEKVEKTAESNKVYATDQDGKDIALPYATDPDGGAIVKRSENGHIKLPITPEADDDAASKKFVEDTASKVLPTSPTGNGDHVLGIKGGELKYIDVIADTPDPQNHAGAVVGYGGGGRVRVGDAVHDQDAANKRFVKTELLLKADALQEKPQDWLNDAYGLYLMDESGKQVVIAATDDAERLPYIDRPTIVMRDRYYPQCVSTGTPEADYHATPRWYVDSLILSGSYQHDGTLRIRLSDPSGETISDVDFDLPLEQFVQSGELSEDGTKIILTLNTGNTVEIKVSEIVSGVASKDFVTNAVAGKVDKTDKASKVYGTDADGNPTTYGVNPNVDMNKAIVQRNEGGQVNVPLTHSSQYNATSKGYVDEELAKKVNVFSNGTNHMYVYSVAPNSSDVSITPTAVSPKQYQIARYNAIGEGGTSAGNGCLTTSDPSKLYHCANKKYVDDQVAPIIKELGSIVKTITDSSSEVVIETPVFLPDGVKPNIYIEYATASLPWIASDGRSDTTEVDFSQIMVGDESGPKRTIDIERGSYITLEDGENMLFFGMSYPYPSAPDDSGDWTPEAATPLLSYKIIYQVKVGA